MIPAGFIPFFTASAGAAGALIGLLYIAISIAPERTVGKSATPEREAVVANAYTALTNVFFITLVALIPAPSLGSVLLLVGVLSFVATLRLARNLFMGRWRGEGRLSPMQVARRLVLVMASLLIYGAQVWLGAQVQWAHIPVSGAFGVAAVQIVGVYGLALLRMWSLMGARKDSLFAWLSVLNDLDDNG